LTLLVYFKAAVDIWIGRIRIIRVADLAAIEAEAAPMASIVVT